MSSRPAMTSKQRLLSRESGWQAIPLNQLRCAKHSTCALPSHAGLRLLFLYEPAFTQRGREYSQLYADIGPAHADVARIALSDPLYMQNKYAASNQSAQNPYNGNGYSVPAAKGERLGEVGATHPAFSSCASRQAVLKCS